MTHIDKNSFKHFSVCFLLSLVGAYGMSASIDESRDRQLLYSNCQGANAIEWSSFISNPS